MSAGYAAPPAGFGGFGGTAYPMPARRPRHPDQPHLYRRHQRPDTANGSNMSMPVTQAEWEPYIGAGILVVHSKPSGAYNTFEYLGEFCNDRPVFQSAANPATIYWDGERWCHHRNRQFRVHTIGPSKLHTSIPPLNTPWVLKPGSEIRAHISGRLRMREFWAWDDRRHHQFTARTRKQITTMALIAGRVQTPQAAHWLMMFREMNEIDFAKNRKVDSRRPDPRFSRF